MAQPQHGGPRAPDRKPRPPSGPGRLSQRTDMSQVTPAGMPAQGVYSPTAADDPSMQYGDAKRLDAAQSAVPLPSATPAAAPPPPGPGPATGPRAAAPAAAQPGMTPQDLVAMLSSHDTEFPSQPLAAPGTPPSQSMAFKVDALRYLSTLPFAGPEIQSLLKKAQIEYDQAQRQSFMPPMPGLPAAPEQAPPPMPGAPVA